MRSHFWKACLTNSGIFNRSENIPIYKIYTRQIEIKFIAFFFIGLQFSHGFEFPHQRTTLFFEKRFNVSAWLIRYFNMCGLYFSLNYMLTILLKTITNKLKYFWQLKRVQKRRLANSIIILSGNCLKWCVGV